MLSLCLFLVSIVFFILCGVSWTDAHPWSDRACNNSPNLCFEPYDKITHLGAHDSPFLRDASTDFNSFGNQYFSTTVQLDAGVRLLSAQVHVDTDAAGKRELHVCHTTCGLFDAGPLREWLIEVRTWLDRNANEVVTLLLVNSDGVDARELQGVYSQANLAHYGYVPLDIQKPPPPSNETETTWPILGDMIDRGERLLTFVNPLAPDVANAPYLLDEFTFVWENSYEVTNANNFTCAPDRPERAPAKTMLDTGRLFLMNHFLYQQQAFGIQVPDEFHVNTTNAWEGPGALGSHMLACANEVTRQPTFVLVDFFNVGQAFEVVDNFNQVSKPVGRIDATENVSLDGLSRYPGAAGERKMRGLLLVVMTLTAVIWNTLALW